MISFKCSGCGCCCKRIKLVIDNLDIDFPYGYDENGVCDMLVDNKCSVYETRPLICNVDELFKFSSITREEYYKINHDACNKMMEEDGIDKSFRV